MPKRPTQISEPVYELLAHKMVMLIERGTPSDFFDIYKFCHNGFGDAHQCWQTWEMHQRTENLEPDRQRATLAIYTHLARFAQARPLPTIAEVEERATAEALRRWFAQEFVCDFPN